MRKIAWAAAALLMVGACSKHDPILPGVRTAIFDAGAPVVLGAEIENLPAATTVGAIAECPYRQDASNTIWNGDRKIFSGFSTNNSVRSNQTPVCAGGYVIAGLTTGEVVKVNPNSRQVVWVADVYRASNMTGGASVLDIIAPIVVDGDYVYAGGLGDAFCKINIKNGNAKWCTQIGVATPFIIASPAAFVMATDGAVYAVRLSDGAVYWRTEIDGRGDMQYANGVLSVGRQKINAATGDIIK